MRTQRNGKRKKGITLLLILAMMLSLTLVGSAHWANHATRPTETYNTEICQINSTAQTVTFTQSSAWTNALAGEAKVDLSFDGAEYVMKEISGYDFALIFDGSGSPNESASKESAKVFVSNVIMQNPDAHFTVIKNSFDLPVYIRNANNQAAVNSAITSIPWTSGLADFVQPACEKVYDLHKASGRDTDLMIVIISDGDFCYVPGSWTTRTGISFTTNYRGDSYYVNVSNALINTNYNPRITCTSNGIIFYYSNEGITTSGGSYIITKNDTLVEPGDSVMRASWAKTLYFNEFCQKELRADGVVFASICTPKDVGVTYRSYAATVANFPGAIIARNVADEGYNFEINSNDYAGYVNAFSELETAIMTRVVTLNTTIDNRYFTVDETALESVLPEDCTYKITNTIRDGVVVQDVEIIYQLIGAAALNISVSIPVTINSDIPREAFDSDKFLPIVYDGASSDGAAGCLFVDLNGDEQEISTRKVHIDATDFARYDDALFEATAENVILRGNWAQESSGDVVFWVSYDGAPITQDHLDAVTFTTSAPALRWENVSRVLHTKGVAVLTGETDGNFAQVKVSVDVKESGVSAITMAGESAELATGYVITPGDTAAIYGILNASDIGTISRVVNNVPGAVFPLKGLANNFDFEMMDMTKDGIINASDAGALSRIVNQLTDI